MGYAGALNLPSRPKSTPLPKASGLSIQADDINWAVNECAEADLGEVRRTKRLVARAHVLAQPPTAALPEACGDGAMRNAAYRFVSHDDIEPPDFLSSPIESTDRRLDKGPLVLAGQDTTDVDWPGHPATTGLGPRGHTACHGLHVHSTLACTPARVPLGLLAQHMWARAPDDVGQRTRRQPWPMSQQERQQWLSSLAAVCSARGGGAHTRVVSVGDREAEVCDLRAAEPPAGVELLVRAAWDRCVDVPEPSVWPRLRRHRWWSPSSAGAPSWHAAQPRRHAGTALVVL